MSSPATPPAPTPTTPAIVHTRIRHVRTEPLRNEFEYRSYSWLVDVDQLPVLPKPLRSLARFDAADHLGDPTKTLRGNVEAFLTSHNMDLAGGRILMLTNARVFGHVFNPLTVFWCLNEVGSVRAVVAEVHNTYGERHCYLLNPDERGAARTDKEFYVSPFNDVSGEYRMRLPLPEHSLSLSIVLARQGHAPFVATVSGECVAATKREILRSAISIPMAPLRVSVQIRYQGIRLWARRLPIVPRLHHQPQEAVQ
ncbi:DUF1365 domain-containing protein [Rhodococcus sp. IEGM 1379]|uniref:DUF1365 domain-containing protein n=1 Tax=Rhodococcus sp. IEGM 1379 TaxID=3047086 RepID=UPI0024B7094F|nr:DUF1365 domain-containing protein [Rhodococcus sp. IEGM 1379]MDI9917943.1 DUF1365 domain-containing protein [Rhodococcus sp. IEGM 1379]